MPGVAGKLERLVVELDVTHQRVVEPLAAGAVVAHVVGGPAETEVLAACGELPDEIGQVLVVGVAPGLGT